MKTIPEPPCRLKVVAMPHRWIADRAAEFDSSGIRKVFDLASKLTDPINLSIGQPHFAVPDEIKQAAIEAIGADKNSYALTQGAPALREKLLARVRRQYAHADRDVFVASGTSGGLVLAMLAFVNPGDEVILFDPFFVMYAPLVSMAGGRCVHIDTYPDFRIDVQAVADAITPKTKAIVFNSPANPTGYVATEEEIRCLAELARAKQVLLISDEIYRDFCYDRPFVSPASFNDQTLVIDGFSKTYGVTGWRLGFAHGPSELIDTMVKLQQYTFVCAPHPFQWAAVAAMDVDMGAEIEQYRRKRDMIYDGLKDRFELVKPGGAFYAFCRVPTGETGEAFVKRAIERGLLIIPGGIFSQQDTHFRISYAAEDATIQRGVDVLNELAQSE